MADSDSITHETTNASGVGDAVLTALAAERATALAHQAALAALDKAGAFMPEPPTHATIAWQPYSLADLEQAEFNAGWALSQAEKEVLAAQPTTVCGATAQIGFLRRFIADCPSVSCAGQGVVGTLERLEAFLRVGLAQQVVGADD